MTEREEKERRGSGAENEMGGRRRGLRGWGGGGGESASRRDQ